MVEWLSDVIQAIGYPGIFVLMVLEMFVPVVQTEVVMTFSGFAAAQGQLSFAAVLVAGIAGSQLGSVALYWLARLPDRRRVNEVVDRYGGWLGLHRERMDRGEELFERHELWAVVVGRFLPGVRGFIAVPAGVQRMGFWRFFAANLAGTAFWVGVMTALGALLGEHWRAVDQYSSYVTWTVLGALGAYVLWRLGLVARDQVTA